MDKLEEQFLKAITDNDIKTVKIIIENSKIKPDIKNNYALRWASYYNYTDLVFYLLDLNLNLDAEIKKYILFSSAHNNNFILFKKIYNKKDFDLLKIEYKNTNILLTLIDKNPNCNKDFIYFILEEIKHNINRSYIRDTFEIAFENGHIDILDVLIEFNLQNISNKPLEDFFEESATRVDPSLPLKFFKMIEKHFDLNNSKLRFYYFLINAILQEHNECIHYIFKNYNVNDIPKNLTKILINSILRSENISLLKYINNLSFLNNEEFLKSTINELIFEDQISSITYILEHYDIPKYISEFTLSKSLEFRSYDLIFILFKIINTDYSFDNLYLIRKLMEIWSNDKEQQLILNILLNKKEINNKLNISWIEDNIIETKKEFFKLEYNIKRF
jgi:hypothetical protein